MWNGLRRISKQKVAPRFGGYELQLVRNRQDFNGALAPEGMLQALNGFFSNVLSDLLRTEFTPLGVLE
jgi:hypothetical protein